MKKLLVLALCISFIGVFMVNSTFAYSAGRSNTNLFQKVAEWFGFGFGSDPESDETQVQATNQYYQRTADGTQLVEENADTVLSPSIYGANFSWNDRADAVELQNNPLYFWPNTLSGAVDKVMLVQNTGTKSIYFRTAFAYESNGVNAGKLHLNFNRYPANSTYTDPFVWSEPKDITINGKNYVMVVATYKYALEAGNMSPPMLLQVALDHASGMTNEILDSLDSQYLRVQTLAIEEITKDGVPVDAVEALNLAVPIDADFNPFV